jgi:RsiW-degrading membrane proteinase PrsW (M82 family)
VGEGFNGTVLSASAAPPESTAPTAEGGFHGPPTNWFLGIRARLAALEDPFQLPSSNFLRNGLLVSLIFAASVGFLLSYLIELAILPSVGFIAIAVFIGPLIEESAKALGMFVVAYLMWKSVPNRRYGAVLGAAAGLGFGVAENCVYIYRYAVAGDGVAIVSRIIGTPLMHPLWSAFVGIGVFAQVANSRPSQHGSPKSPLWLPFLFLLVGLSNHIVWNSLAVGLGLLGLGYVPLVLDILIIFPYLPKC